MHFLGFRYSRRSADSQRERVASGLSRLLGALATCLAVTVTGCASYKPQPISPAHTATALESRTLENPRLQQFIEAALGRGGKADETSAWDVSRLVLAALYYHPDLDIARAKLAVARAGVMTAQQVPNPNLGIGLGYNGTVTTPTPWTIGSVVNFLVETFGRRQYRTAQAEALTQAARNDLATAAWQVRGRVRTAAPRRSIRPWPRIAESRSDLSPAARRSCSVSRRNPTWPATELRSAGRERTGRTGPCPAAAARSRPLW